MSQYNPNVNEPLVIARIEARAAEASRRRLVAAAGGRRHAPRSSSSIRESARAVRELLRDPGVVSGRGPIGPIR